MEKWGLGKAFGGEVEVMVVEGRDKGLLVARARKNNASRRNFGNEIVDLQRQLAEAQERIKVLIDCMRGMFTEDEGLQAVTLADMQGYINEYDKAPKGGE